MQLELDEDEVLDAGEEEIEIVVVNNVPYIRDAKNDGFSLPASGAEDDERAHGSEAEPGDDGGEEIVEIDPDELVQQLHAPDMDADPNHEPPPRKNLKLEATSRQHLKCHKPYN